MSPTGLARSAVPDSEPVVVRRADERDLAAVSRLTVAAYEPYLLGPDDPYRERLADAAARRREAELWVALRGDHVVGAVTACPEGSPWREIAEPGEDEFRMLAVDPDRQGGGVGSALVTHLLGRARDRARRGVAISSLSEMHPAHRLYARLGFLRSPQRDWSPHPGVSLLAFVAATGSADRLASGGGD